MSKNIEEIFKQHYSPLCNYASKIVKSSTDAEDIVQSLFVQLWEKEQLKNIKHLERFLLRATKFKCIDFLRKKKKEQWLEINETITLDIHTPHSFLNEEDIEPLLAYFTAKLPPKTRKVFLLSRTAKMTYKEIAQELNISHKTVETHLSKALKIIRKLLKEHDLLAIYFLSL